jgi:sensor c-di-GMP phosphodiesterase-like protein
MRPLQQRVLLTVSATLIMSACGALAGYLVGRDLTLRHAAARLEPYASRILLEGETAGEQARALLATINASPHPFCSDAEVAWFRKLVFQSEYLKDAGRIRDGRVDCAATLGRLDQPTAETKPDFTRQDGTRVYRNLVPFQIPGQDVVTLQVGDSFVVYNPWNLKDLGSASMHFTVSDVDIPTGQTVRLVGELSQAPVQVLLHNGQSRVGNTLYATRCSARYASCMTAYISTPEALRANLGEFRTYIFLGALGGAIIGFSCSVIYRRIKGIERQLRRAIRREALTVVYQPIVELATGRIVAAEALVRWTDEDNSVIGPDVFVRIAEKRGFVGEITRLVVSRSLRDFKKTFDRRPDFHVNVNIAAADLADPAFLPMLEQSLERAGVKPGNLGMEITERHTAGKQVAKDAILRLRQQGHLVYIDDFGTGYSSLAYLHDLSVDAIKIDRAFTGAIGTEAVTVAILPQILAMADALKLRIIVEGVETAEQRDYFVARGQSCLAQGWLYGYPVASEEFLRALAAGEKNASAPAEPG